ncbi:non-heme iron oxygenase ferredoxin subunit [Pigmentiphaga sp. H8]|uniref:Rieske (2Fe-2S) protein n=1 Tax=unclassified Pigmentiphaga TaxID=2626614 RepID=UPI000F59A7EF|nr:non-heme iron oxygenase ferredoxin subunit [Pigmentiphaga sp. H8]AZG06813.1 non-heme iron oxygenase ferredoxin subunit [Pigmentiphaga sp. H8]
MTWHPVARAADIGPDEALPVEAGGRAIALIAIDGRICAVDDVCTHEFAMLSDGLVEDGCIECPLHQARFRIDTGARVSGPECAGLSVYETKVDAGTVYVKTG